MSDDRAAAQAALLADHKARLAQLPPLVTELPPGAGGADQRRANRNNASRALAVRASCVAYAKAVHEMRERHLAEDAAAAASEEAI